jgi:2'-phosphotransferase
MLQRISLPLKLQSNRVRPLNVTLEEIQTIVQNNDKKRFTLITIADPPSSEEVVVDETNPSHYLIRANQGHSIKVEAEGLLQPITYENAPSTVVHGTTRKAWSLIVSSGGLKPMGRNHVHFAKGLPAGFKRIGETDKEDEEQAPVISGMRNSSAVLIYIDIGKAMDLGLKFWESDNGVILSDGGDDGVIPLSCFQSVEDRNGRKSKLLAKDGQVIDS